MSVTPEFVKRIALEEGVDPTLALALVEKESSFIPSAIGDRGQSFGLLQVQLPTASELLGRRVSAQELLDPEFGLRTGLQVLKRKGIFGFGGARTPAGREFVKTQLIAGAERIESKGFVQGAVDAIRRFFSLEEALPFENQQRAAEAVVERVAGFFEQVGNFVLLGAIFVALIVAFAT